MFFRWLQRSSLFSCSLYAQAIGCYIMLSNDIVPLHVCLYYDFEIHTCIMDYFHYTDTQRKHHLSDKIHWTNVGVMLVQRLRRCTNITPTLVQCIVFAGMVWPVLACIYTQYLMACHGIYLREKSKCVILFSNIWINRLISRGKFVRARPM